MNKQETNDSVMQGQRAEATKERGQVGEAVMMMMIDMDKRPDTKVNDGLVMFGMMTIQNHDTYGARRFIEGFR